VIRVDHAMPVALATATRSSSWMPAPPDRPQSAVSLLGL
jgi:hypothetical protein